MTPEDRLGPIHSQLIMPTVSILLGGNCQAKHADAHLSSYRTGSGHKENPDFEPNLGYSVVKQPRKKREERKNGRRKEREEGGEREEGRMERGRGIFIFKFISTC